MWRSSQRTQNAIWRTLADEKSFEISTYNILKLELDSFFYKHNKWQSPFITKDWSAVLRGLLFLSLGKSREKTKRNLLRFICQLIKTKVGTNFISGTKTSLKTCSSGCHVSAGMKQKHETFSLIFGEGSKEKLFIILYPIHSLTSAWACFPQKVTTRAPRRDQSKSNWEQQHFLACSATCLCLRCFSWTAFPRSTRIVFPPALFLPFHILFLAFISTIFFLAALFGLLSFFSGVKFSVISFI